MLTSECEVEESLPLNLLVCYFNFENHGLILAAEYHSPEVVGDWGLTGMGDGMAAVVRPCGCWPGDRVSLGFGIFPGCSWNPSGSLEERRSDLAARDQRGGGARRMGPGLRLRKAEGWPRWRKARGRARM